MNLRSTAPTALFDSKSKKMALDSSELVMKWRTTGRYGLRLLQSSDKLEGAILSAIVLGGALGGYFTVTTQGLHGQRNRRSPD
jgi:hypothetical protein